MLIKALCSKIDQMRENGPHPTYQNLHTNLVQSGTKINGPIVAKA